MDSNGLQLSLPFWSRGTLKEALDSYRRVKMPYLANGTLKSYFENESWLVRKLGEATPLKSITMETLERIWDDERKNPRGLMAVTARMKFYHLLAAIRYAAKRKVIARDEVPDMPFIPNDSRPGDRVLGVTEFTTFRDALAGGAQDFADLSYWTGHRAADIHTMERWHLDCDWEWKDHEGHVVALGRFWRRSSKTKMHQGRPVAAPAWIIMEPEARAAAQRILARPGSRDSLVVGRVWGLSKSFAAACDRCGIPRISPSRDLRRSFASMLAARGYDRLYVQMALGHSGALEYNMLGEFVRVRFGTVADRHYIRPTAEMMVRQALLRRAI